MWSFRYNLAVFLYDGNPIQKTTFSCYARPERVFITHSGCEQETVEKVRAYLKELDIFDEILETRAGGVVSSHCGPGTLSVLYIAK